MPSILKIVGFGIAYPLNLVPTEDLEKLAYKWHKPSPALDKVLTINRRTGIKTRSLIYPEPPAPPSIKEVSEIFLKEGVALAVTASRLAVAEAGIAFEQVTHVVATTCTNSSNPGFDSFLAQELGLRPSVEKVLLHGLGCAGGLAGLRLAASLCHAAAWRGEPAHVLLIACQITSSVTRDELEVRIGVTLFGDGTSALILSLDPGGSESKRIYELINWAHLKTSTGQCTPGGGAILSATQDAMQLDEEHMRTSWDVYGNHGNTSSVSVLSVLNTVRRGPGREWVMSVAFGPGVAAEEVLLRRVQ
ncbi:thiolase-like protein [Mycena epipterygia]|nr:thiolase-like protein [Mycena epipterygia]